MRLHLPPGIRKMHRMRATSEPSGVPSHTLGFVAGVCNACRSLREEPHPAAESFGRTSKVARYYWREIHCESLSRFDKWARGQGFSGWMAAAAEHASVRKQIEKEVLDEVKATHRRAPKYTFSEDSQDVVIQRHSVEVLALRATYVRSGDRLLICDGEDRCGTEVFAARHFERLGWHTLSLESRPFHVLFGTFMWMLIEDHTDPLGRVVSFGDRDAFDRDEKSPMIGMTLPADFGFPGYAARRVAAVNDHFEFLGRGRDQLLWTFDYWIEPSGRLRQYLWAHKPDDVDRARAVLQALPADVILSILRFLVHDYWGRYLGWPDLLCHREDGSFFFAEVKSSRDKLSGDQKKWIGLNAEHLHFPFKLVKIHRGGFTQD